MKKGFTLIELLAVMVIIMIIATIAVPIVINIVDNTENSALLSSADFYLDAVELSLAQEVLEGFSIDGEYTINSSGNICKDEACIEVEVQGQKPTSGKIIIEDGKIKSIYKLTIDDKKISTDSSGNLAIKKYNTYTVTYKKIDDTTNLPTTVEEEDNIVIDLENKEVTSFKVYINEEEVTNYTYENNILTIQNVTGNVVVRKLNIYTVTYENIEDVSGLPTTVLEENTLKVDLTGQNISSEKLTVKVNNKKINNYTYENYILTVEEVTGNVIIKGYKKYTVTYEFIDSNDAIGLTSSIIEGNTLKVDLKNKSILDNSIIVKVNDEVINNYTYTNYVLTLTNVTGNVVITEVLPPFSTDSWDVIIANVKAGNTDSYNVGDKKKITLTSKDTNIAGTYVVRLANKTVNDSEGVCTNETYSQTACGFVIEFVDIITTHKMQSTFLNGGGWPATLMRQYITPSYNDNGVLIDESGTIYNALPEEIRNNIIDTRVISGYGKGNADKTNYTSIDKLYLLSAKEIYGTAYAYDMVSAETRQLDYYSRVGVTSNSNRSFAIKYLNGTAKAWWQRSADSRDSFNFCLVSLNGYNGSTVADMTYGVAPAFRLG